MAEIIGLTVALLAEATLMLSRGGEAPAAAIAVTVLFGASLFVVACRLKRGNVRLALASFAVAAGFLFWYGYPAMVALLTDWSFDHDLPLAVPLRLVPVAATQLVLFLWVWAVVVRLIEATARRGATRTGAAPARAGRLLLVALALGVAGCIPVVTSGLTPEALVEAILGGRTAEKPWAYWSNLGNETSWLLFLAQSAMIAASTLLLAIGATRGLRRAKRLAALGAALIFFVIVFFDQGVRSVTALIVLPTALTALLLAWRRSKLKVVVVGLCLVVLLFVVSQFQMIYRISPTRGQMRQMFFEDWPTLGRQIDYFREHLYALSIVPRFHDYFRESVVLEFVSSPIPRFLWPGKPASQVTWFYTLCRWGRDIWVTPGNIFPGLVGQFYMSWSWLGSLFAGALMGLLSAVFDRIIARRDPRVDRFGFVAASMLACCLFLSYRNLAPGPFYPVIVAGLAVWISRARLGSAVKVTAARPSETRIGATVASLQSSDER